MANTYVHILTKHEYKMTRCQDGIILLFPIEGQLKLQHFTKTVSVENDIYVINNTDIFSIIENNKKNSPFVACGNIEFKNNNSNSLSLLEAVVGSQITKILLFSQPKSNGLLSRISK